MAHNNDTALPAPSLLLHSDGRQWAQRAERTGPTDWTERRGTELLYTEAVHGGPG